MKALKTSAILALAVGLFLISAAFVPAYYPAAKPVLAADGSPVLGPDGKVVTHRDMAKYYRVNRTAYILRGCSGCLFAWWLVRVSRHLYARFQEGRNETSGSSQ
jgi:hypothetical protein